MVGVLTLFPNNILAVINNLLCIIDYQIEDVRVYGMEFKYRVYI